MKGVLLLLLIRRRGGEEKDKGDEEAQGKGKDRTWSCSLKHCCR
jgi:hypothetical protein